jgi:outer membrane lipoprotein-sorting protein
VVLKSALLAASGLLLAAAQVADRAGPPLAPAFDAEDVLAKTRAAYPALNSYADSGTVLEESPGFTDRSTFRTLYLRDPRYLLIDYKAIASEYKNGFRVELNDRKVFWMVNGELQTWFSKTQAHETYPSDGGQQVNALNNASGGTVGISVLIPSHLYTKSGMASAVHAITEPEADGFETVNGQRCFRITGVERWRYPSGRETGVRPITVWIDAESYLIHKIVQDTPKGMPRGSISRRITTLKHQVNPKLDPSQFRFTVPAI